MIELIHSTEKTDAALLIQTKRAFQTFMKREDIGFHRLPEMRALWEASEARATLLKTNCSRMAVLGIGGSSLGGLALTEALRKKNVSFFENVDSKDFWETLRAWPEVESTHWVIVSKSGKTVETLTQASFLAQHLKSKNIDLSKNCTVITEFQSSPLLDWAKLNDVPTLEVPLNVGGRFSVLCPVGLVPAAFSGVNLESLRKGALWSLKQDELIAELSAKAIQSFNNDKWITVFWAYCSQLRSFGLWIEQLWAESLAKKTDRLGQVAHRVSTPISLIGANDQHSVLQQVSEGHLDKFVWFMRVKESETFGPRLEHSLFKNQDEMLGKSMGELLAAEAHATRSALEASGVHSLTLELNRLDDQTVGALFMLYELVTATIGEALNINAFDQPGVELGKRLARDILSKS
jgi:glucose-6-phosphate isomerase